MKSYWFHSGVSLVELVVAMAVLAALMVLAAPSYNQWIENSRIRTTAESIQQGLQLARSEAVKRNSEIQFVLEENFSWFIGCVLPNENDFDDDGQPDCPSEIQRRSAKEGSSTTVTATFTPGDVTIAIFNDMGRIASPVTSSFEMIQVSTSALDENERRDLRLIIGVDGSVRMCDPALPVTDPRACQN